MTNSVPDATATASEKPQSRRGRFDFSKLDTPISTLPGSAQPTTPKNQINVVLELSLDEIEEDPDQPRKKFDEEALQELANEIKNRGVQQPINVRPKGANGKHMIFQGARRYRASLLAGKTTIPAIIRNKDETGFDDYAQVTENTQRENLSALDLAEFIVRKKNEGKTGKEIAKALSMRESAITRHLSLLDAPKNLLEAFKSGRIAGVEVFYELTKLVESNPDLAANLVLGEGEITLAMIRSAKKTKLDQEQSAGRPNNETEPVVAQERLEPEAPTARREFALEPSPPNTDPTQALELENGNPEQKVELTNPSSDNGQNGHLFGNESGTGENLALDPQPASPPVQKVPYHNPELDKKEPTKADPSKIKKPLLLGKHADRDIKVLLQRTPSMVGLIHIQYEDTMEEAEVSIGEIQLTALHEMRQQEKA